MEQPIKYTVIIITHGRADTMKTDEMFRRKGYTGPIYYLIDNEDKQQDLYKEKYGDKVVMFDKTGMTGVDTGDNFPRRDTPLFVRNKVYDVAADLGYENFLMVDDDYFAMQCRMDSDYMFSNKQVVNLDEVFQVIFRFYLDHDIKLLTVAQGGDYIGGQFGTYGSSIFLARKAMNMFFCSTKRRVTWVSRLNDDVSTYTIHSLRGLLFFTISMLSIVQPETQQNKGGITDAYLDMGTYVKSFYTVMYAPSCCKVSVMTSKFPRIHHRICKDAAYPKILSDQWKK